MLFILCHSWKMLFFYKNLFIPGFFNRHVLAVFETSDLKEVRISFFTGMKLSYIILAKFSVLL